jgi:hypothetical protein
MMATETRRLLHELLDSIDEQNLEAAQAFLEFLAARHGTQMLIEERAPGAPSIRDVISDPVLREFLAAPDDDEDLTDEDIAAIEEGKADVAAGRVVTREQIERRWPPPF